MKIKNILTQEIEDFDLLNTFKLIPIFNGTTDTQRDNDLLYDMNFA